MINISVNSVMYSVPAQISVSAALATVGITCTRVSVSGMPRAAFCGMGICQECRVCIDDRLHQLGCQTLCTDGMQIATTIEALNL